MPVDPRLFAGPNLGQLFMQGQQSRIDNEARAEEQKFRLGALMQRQQEAEAERTRAVQERQREALTRIAPVVAQRPYEQRRAFIQSIAPQLRQFDITDEQIMGFDPTDDNLAALSALGGQREQQATALERDYQFMERIQPGLGRQMLEGRADPLVQMDVTGDGIPDIAPRSAVMGRVRGGQPSSAPVRVNTPEEARQLPPGTVFQTPDGRTMRVPGGAGSGQPNFR